MPKFYIKSGNLKYIVDKEDYQSAIISALIYAKEKSIMTGLRVCYSEQGFVSFKKWVCDDIENYLKEI